MHRHATGWGFTPVRGVIDPAVVAGRAPRGPREVALGAATMRAIHKKIGDILRSLGQDDGAIGAYRHALELDPDFAVVRYELARLLAAKGQTREAEQADRESAVNLRHDREEHGHLLSEAERQDGAPR